MTDFAVNETSTRQQHGPAAAPRVPTWTRVERRLVEALEELADRFVDPRDAYDDGEGAAWISLGAADGAGRAPAVFVTEQQLAEVRAQCRALAATNEFAINGHENRVSYIVGRGHTYRATNKKDATAPAALAASVQAFLDEFLRINRWHSRQPEIVRRRDRDGEVFLRLFTAPDGMTRLRFVEPGNVTTPPHWHSDPAASFGIRTEPDDVETPLAYFIDGEEVAAADIQHRKGNVDVNVKRGLPLFYPVRKNLRRAEKLLRNMSVVAEIQSAIALIRRHQVGTHSGVQRFVAEQADASAQSAAGGTVTHFARYAPGTIIDAQAGVEYEFPAAAIDAGKYVTVLQAELRAIASRLVMPEFMLTSDASNANYSSTLVAEGPAVRMFQRLQAEQIADDLELLWRVIERAVAAGRLDSDALVSVEIQVAPPSLVVRDPLEEARVRAIEYQHGLLSPQTWSQLSGLDYDQEQMNRRAHGGSAAALSTGSPQPTLFETIRASGD